MVFSSVYLQDNLMSQIGPRKQVLKARMPKLKAGILKPGITKIKHRTDKGCAGSHVRRKQKYGGPQLSRQKQFSLVFVYFYSQFYSLPKNFWFRPLLTFSITLTISIHNLEIKSPTNTLFSGGQSVLL